MTHLQNANGIGGGWCACSCHKGATLTPYPNRYSCSSYPIFYNVKLQTIPDSTLFRLCKSDARNESYGWFKKNAFYLVLIANLHVCRMFMSPPVDINNANIVTQVISTTTPHEATRKYGEMMEKYSHFSQFCTRFQVCFNSARDSKDFEGISKNSQAW